MAARLCCTAVLLLLLACLPTAADDGDASPESATISETPQDYLQASLNNARKRMDGKYTGDAWTWHACFPMDGFIDAYLATGEEAWLDAAATYFDWNIDQLLTGPDGRRGWLGAAYRMPGRLSEYPVGDALVIGPMVRFAEVVLKDRPELAERFGEHAERYVKLARELVFDKWDARGIWHVDGPYGAYTNWPWTFTEAAPDRWCPPPAGTKITTLPMNMQVKWGTIAARLHRITGEAAWRTRAEQVFGFAKSRLNLYDGHYSWNYWEPFGPWDVVEGDPQNFNTWINTHPYRNYQSGEVEAFVVAYNHGIVFDATDIERLVRTNIEVMWNGEFGEATAWNNSNAGVQKAALGEIRRGSRPASESRAGTLWTALAPFDATVRKLYEQQLGEGTPAAALYRNVTAATPPGYARRTDVEPKTMDFPFHPCSTITMAAAIPADLHRGEFVLVACQGRTGGEVVVELRSADGERRVAELGKAELARAPFIHNLSWDSSDAKPGRYRIRWTLGDEVREFPIEIH